MTIGEQNGKNLSGLFKSILSPKVPAELPECSFCGKPCNEGESFCCDEHETRFYGGRLSVELLQEPDEDLLFEQAREQRRGEE